ncbi:ATP synthase subunit I [Desulfoluna sp.]|uniref:ATP synthase subunit I n=1 Tax=Desulfoluna sp. TaxID=2045199 RepID=UPI002634BC5C|nr:ATP synthase subunit I [Desulfoluna sp.]
MGFVTRANWVILALAAVLGPIIFSADVALGVTCGGLIVTINFHLLSRTLEKGLRPTHLSSGNVILAKYYVRFLISAVIIFFLISKHLVDPLGLILGLSVVVVSVTLATVCELMKLIFREAV